MSPFVFVDLLPWSSETSAYAVIFQSYVGWQDQYFSCVFRVRPWQHLLKLWVLWVLSGVKGTNSLSRYPPVTSFTFQDYPAPFGSPNWVEPCERWTVEPVCVAVDTAWWWEKVSWWNRRISGKLQKFEKWNEFLVFKFCMFMVQPFDFTDVYYPGKTVSCCAPSDWKVSCSCQLSLFEVGVDLPKLQQNCHEEGCSSIFWLKTLDFSC